MGYVEDSNELGKKAARIGSQPQSAPMDSNYFLGPQGSGARKVLSAIGFNVNSAVDADGMPVQQPAPALAGGAATPAAAPDPLAAIRAKDAAITTTPTVPTIAGITPGMVQRSAASTSMAPASAAAPSVAGGIQKSVGAFSETKFSDGSGGFAMNEQNRLAEVSRQNAAEQERSAGGVSSAQPRYESTSNINPNPSSFDLSFVGKASMSNPSYRNAMVAKAVLDRNTANDQAMLGRNKDLQIAGMSADTARNSAAQNLAGVKYNADAHTKAAQIAGDAGVIKAKQAAQAKTAENGQKDHAERVKGLMGDWSKLNLPKEYVPKLNEFAQIHADAENPNGKTFLMAPNREGGMYAALPKQYEAQYNKLLQTMPHNDAASRVFGIAQQNGHVVANVPDFRRFMPTNEAIKQQNNTVLAGA